MLEGKNKNTLYYDDEFENVREEALLFYLNKYKKLIEDWCHKAKLKSPVGYFNNTTDRIMEIYTDRPGVLIGKAGSLVYEFKEKLKEEFGIDYEVKFIDIRGGFVNY